MKHLAMITVVLLFALSGNAQQVLTLDDAIKMALQKNHGILVASNQQKQVENSATAGNAGLLPSVDVTGGATYSATTADLEFAGGQPPIEDAEALAFGYNGAVGLNYTLFDGLGSFHSFNKLKSQRDLSAIQTNLTIESTLLQVSNVYYEVARQQVQLEIAKESLKVSQGRRDRLQANLTYGTVSSLDLLNAQVDLNSDSSNVLSLEMGLKSAKRNLNVLMGTENGGVDYTVDENLTINRTVALADLKSKAEQNNVNVLLAQSNITIAEYDQKLQKSFRMPRIGLNASYGYNYQESNASLILNQSSLGFTGGVSLAWNLFDGKRKQTALANAQIALETSEIQKEQAMITVSKDVENAFDLYQNSLVLVDIEQKNLQIAELNFQRSQELYNQGQLTTTEFREAQLNLNRVKSRLNTSRFTAKMAEIELTRLSGELVSR